MKVLSLVDLSDEQQQKLAKIPGLDLQIVPKAEVTPEDLNGVEVLFDWSDKLREAVIKSDSLNWIQVKRVGVDALPLQELDDKGIILTNGAGANAQNIAEQTLAYMLMFERQLAQAVRNQMNNRWDDAGYYDEVAGKTAMIVGAGHIGSLIGQYAQALGMKTIGVRRSQTPTANMDQMVTMDQLADHLKDADFVINVLPETPATVGLFDEQLFQAMSKRAVYINVGRGKTTKTADLVTALQQQTIAGASLDVTDPEPLSADSALWQMDNVIITPHNAGNSVHYGERAFKIFRKNLKSYAENGEVAINEVNFQLGY